MCQSYLFSQCFLLYGANKYNISSFLCVGRLLEKSKTGGQSMRVMLLIRVKTRLEPGMLCAYVTIVVFTFHVLVFFWPRRHNFLDTELKFCVFS